MCSIDGNDAPVAFMNQWLPFMTQSPIAIYIALLTASYFQAASRQIQVENSVDAMAAKGRLINLINDHIVTSGKGINEESIAAVMSLAYNEVSTPIHFDRWLKADEETVGVLGRKEYTCTHERSPRNGQNTRRNAEYHLPFTPEDATQDRLPSSTYPRMSSLPPRGGIHPPT